MNRESLDTGPCFLALLLVVFVVWLMTRANAADQRSRKLGILAIAIGIAAFIPAVFAPAIRDPALIRLLVGFGVLSILFAVGAIVLAMAAFRARRRDSGVGKGIPIIGMVCGVSNFLCGIGIAIVGTGALLPAKVDPRNFRVEAHGFSVTLPTENWRQIPNENVLAAFTGNRPHFMAIVAEARPARTDAQFEEAIAFARKVQRDTPMSEVEERSGLNRHGRQHLLFMGWATGPNGPYFFGMSVTRVGEKAVVMMFDGQSRMASEMARTQDNQALRTQAELFLDSVD
jgi:hypothetical protein